ncbi:MAG: hypothetical protein RLZZ292_2240 [Bacteroidota bacterium]|jgi:phage gpG-like protein
MQSPEELIKKLQQANEAILRDIAPNTAIALQGQYDDNFKNQGWEGSPWRDRKSQPKNKGIGRSILVQSGTLRRAMYVRPNGLSVEVGVNSSTAPYAKIHNEGGTIIQKPTFRQRMYFSHRSNAAYKSGDTEGGKRWAAMSLAKQLVIPIPQRQFMDYELPLSPTSARLVKEAIKATMTKYLPKI